MNNKFKFKLKITGFEMEIEGSKEDVNTISSNIGSQLRGLMQPKGINDSSFTEDVDVTVLSSEKLIEEPKGKKTTKRKSGNVNTGKTTKPAGTAIDIKVDPAKYGTPKMTWSGIQKGMWILYVIKQQLSTDELTAGQIANTFNKHFKQSGTIRPSNVSRDFGKQKVTTKYVAQNTTIEPPTWYLTDDGTKDVQSLISQSNGSN